MIKKADSKVGWNFDNSYAHLPKIMLSKIAPVPVQKPQLIILNHILSKELGLDFSILNDEVSNNLLGY